MQVTFLSLRMFYLSIMLNDQQDEGLEAVAVLMLRFFFFFFLFYIFSR